VETLVDVIPQPWCSFFERKLQQTAAPSARTFHNVHLQHGLPRLHEGSSITCVRLMRATNATAAAQTACVCIFRWIHPYVRRSLQNCDSSGELLMTV
jgi:hypothetical protein